jgi:hypothetical protein
MVREPLREHIGITSAGWRFEHKRLYAFRFPRALVFDHQLIHEVLVEKNLQMALALRIDIFAPDAAQRVGIGKENAVKIIQPFHVVVWTEEEAPMLSLKPPEVGHRDLQEFGRSVAPGKRLPELFEVLDIETDNAGQISGGLGTGLL